MISASDHAASEFHARKRVKDGDTMVAGLARSEFQTSYTSGGGKVRERTVVLGAQVIAIENIGSIRIVRSPRSWWIALIGLAIGIGAATQLQTYTTLAYGGIGLGAVLILINMLVPVERGLSIGTSDGRVAMIVSKDQTFLRRLLDFMIEKINSRNEFLTASFDIGGNTLRVTDTTASRPAPVAPAAPSLMDLPEPQPAAIVPDEIVREAATPGEPAATSLPAPSTAADEEDALFANDPEPPLKPRPDPEPPIVRAAATAPPLRARASDPLLDGAGSTAHGQDQDWLKTPDHLAYGGDDAHQGGALRWIVPLLLILLVGGGGAAAWILFGQGGAPSISLFAPPQADINAGQYPAGVTPASANAPADAALAPAPDAATSLPTDAATPDAASVPPLEGSASELAAVAEFTPPEPMVARASGQRYRARPSQADDVPIIAETRNGGEPLQINGHLTLPDGEWYRVALVSGRVGWFKASLAVPRSRFAETFASTSSASAPFVASAPRILEPAEGVKLSGGPQPVRLAWSSLEPANIYIVEVQGFDPVAQRWIEDPAPKRVTVESADELAEAFPAAGAWRWRVRGVSAEGEQSQFSRWAAFAIRD